VGSTYLLEFEFWKQIFSNTFFFLHLVTYCELKAQELTGGKVTLSWYCSFGLC